MLDKGAECCVTAISLATENNDELDVAVPRLDLVARSSGYHGLVDEDKLIVDVTPKIRASGADICTFRIVNKHHAEAPFEVTVTYLFIGQPTVN